MGKIERTAQFGHYVNGPCLEIKCRDFKPTHDHQTVALKKNSSGWHLLTTTAFCLTKCEIDIASYIDDCIPFVLAEVCESQSLASVFFRIVRVYQDVSMDIRGCLQMLIRIDSPDKRVSPAFHLYSLIFYWLAAARSRNPRHEHCP